MSCKTLEVEVEDGRVHVRGTETLPAKAHGLLTLLDSSGPPAALTCGELAERWGRLEKLSLEEANEFADDVEQARAKLPPIGPHDLQIAAAGLALGHEVATRNTQEFQRVTGLKVTDATPFRRP